MTCLSLSPERPITPRAAVIKVHTLGCHLLDIILITVLLASEKDSSAVLQDTKAVVITDIQNKSQKNENKSQKNKDSSSNFIKIGNLKLALLQQGRLNFPKMMFSSDMLAGTILFACTITARYMGHDS